MKALVLFLILNDVAISRESSGCDTPTAIHQNGGGRVALSAHVEPSVFVDEHSHVCGASRLTGTTSVFRSTIVNSHIELSVIEEASIVSSFLLSATVNGSQVFNSKLSRVMVTKSTVTNSNFTSKALNGVTAFDSFTY